VLALLVHAVLLTSVAHATPEARSAAVAHAGGAAYATLDRKAIPPDDDPAPGHPTACGATETAVRSAGNQLDIDN
jgi:hypothetical protein